MNDNKFLEKRYYEINKLKTMLEIYPKKYNRIIATVIDEVCNDVEDYLNAVKERSYLDSTYNRSRMEKMVSRKFSEENISLEDIIRGQRQDLTAEELAKYNGVDGREAYVAINGVIYDVTDANDWSAGKHYGVSAGKDLTSSFDTCHEEQQKYIESLPVVGKLIND